MKRKRLVSLLLAVLLIVSMIPTNALAAISQGSADGNDTVQFTMMVSKNFGKDQNGNTIEYAPMSGGANLAIDSIAKYNTLTGSGAMLYYMTPLTGKSAKEVVDFYSKVFVPDEDNKIDAEDGLAKDETFYLGLKAKLLKPSTYEGLKSAQFQIKYDNSVFEPVLPNGTTVESILGQTGNAGVASIIGVNGTGVVSLTGANKGAPMNITGLDTEEEQRKYAADYKLNAGATSLVNSADGKYGILTVAIDSTNWYIPSDTPWDIVIPMKAKTTVTDGQIEALATFEKESKIYYNNATACTIANGGNLGAENAGAKNLKSDGGEVNFFANDVSVTAVVKSAPPVAEEVDYTGTLKNRQNKPYISANNGDEDANNKEGPYDTLTFPTAETGFVVGDKVYVYADAKGTKELGHTTINDANLYNTGAKKWGETGLADGDAVKDMTLRLVKDDADLSSYIKGQTKVWIGRLVKDASADTVVDKDKLIGIDITPETKVSFSGNLNEDAYKAALGTTAGFTDTAGGPIAVKGGDAFTEVTKQLNTAAATKVQAPVDGGQTVETTLDWDNMTVVKPTTTKSVSLENTFNVYGTVEMTVPFKNVSETVKDSGNNDVTIQYAQPTAYSQLEGSTLKDQPIPTYGVKIYVDVQPNPADFYVEKDETAGTAQLTVTGETANVLKDGDQILVRTPTSGSTDIDTLAWPEGKTDPVALENANKVTVGGEIFVMIKQKIGKDSSGDIFAYSTAIPVVAVKTGDRSVAGDVKVTGDGEDGIVLIDAGAKVKDTFNSLNVKFRLTGLETEIPLQLTDEAIAAADTDTDPTLLIKRSLNSAAEAAGNTGTRVRVSEFDSDNSKEGFYHFEYVIPSNPKPAQATLTGETPQYYTNEKGYKVSFDARVITRLKVDGTVSNIVNRPNGARKDELTSVDHCDTFEIINDTLGQVKVNDTVDVYKENNIVARGVVYKVVEPVAPATNYTYYIKVDQLGTEPVSGLQFVITPPAVEGRPEMPSLRMNLGDFTAEPYSFVKVVPFSPNTFTVNNNNGSGGVKYSTTADIYKSENAADVKLPQRVAVEYARNVYDEINKTYVPDQVNTKTVWYDVTWANGSGFSGNALVGEMDGSRASVGTIDWTKKYAAETGDTETTLSLDGPTAEQQGLAANKPEIFISVVTDTYEESGLPPVADLASASTVSNNAYPKVDKVKVENTTEGVTVYFYATEADATNNVNAVATATLSTNNPEGGFEVKSATGNTDLLNKEGGELFVRARGANTLMSKLPDESKSESFPTVKYGREPFTFWKASISDANATVNLDRTQILTDPDNSSAARSDANQALFVNNALTKTFQIQAVRFVKGEAGPVPGTNDNTKNIFCDVTNSVLLENMWKIPGTTAEPITATNVGTVVGGDGTGTTTTNLVATIDETTFTAAEAAGKAFTATYKIGAETITVPMEFDAPTDAHRLADAGKVTATLNVTQNKGDETWEPVANVEKYIHVTTGANDYPSESTSHKVEFKFVDEAKPDANFDKMIGAQFSFTIGENTVTGTIGTKTETVDSEEVTYPYFIVDTDPLTDYDYTGQFLGFPTNCESLEVTFSKDSQTSSPVSVAVPKITGKLTVTEVVSPRDLSFFTGAIRRNSDLTNLVDDITTVTVKTNNTTTPELTGVELKTNVAKAAGETNNVVWKLWYGTTAGEVTTWTEVEDANWVTTLATYDAAKSYRLTAQLNTDKKYGTGNDKEIGFEGEEILAEVPIMLYNSEDQASISTFPLKLKQGNSDLYKYGDSTKTENANEPAVKEVQKKQTDHAKWTYETFKDDVIAYYFDEPYETSIQPYVDAGMESLTGFVAKDADTDFATWLTNHADKVTVEQLNADGWSLADHPVQFKKYDPDTKTETANGTANRIEPKHSETRADYMVFNGGYSRLDENYFIRYTINYEGHVYMVDRKVKLTYMLGDLDFDGGVTTSDADRADNMSAKTAMFTPRDKTDTVETGHLTALENSIADLDYDGGVTMTDGGIMDNISAKADPPHMRW